MERVSPGARTYSSREVGFPRAIRPPWLSSRHELLTSPPYSYMIGEKRARHGRLLTSPAVIRDLGARRRDIHWHREQDTINTAAAVVSHTFSIINTVEVERTRFSSLQTLRDKF